MKEPWQRTFQSLMHFRVREILLVSSAYDAFVLEEDGSLTDRLFHQYSELSLSWAPRLTHADSAEHALTLLDQRRFDLVITVARIGRTDARALSRSIRQRHPDLPIALLIFDEADLGLFPGGRPPPSIDRVFVWTGSAAVLIAMIKSIEDARNVAHDTRVAGVRVIQVVEDDVRAYSTFLGMLYPELLKQSGSLIAEGLNDSHRLMRMRARPKVLLAQSYEEAIASLDRHGDTVSGLLTDIRIPRAGELASRGGIELGRRVRERHADLPILFQSAERDLEDEARALAAWFVPKNAPDFQAQLKGFLEEALGFGEFVFRLPDRTEVARARDVYEMERALARVPAASVEYHASRHHFSTWLRARSLFQLAERVRPRTLAELGSVEALRSELVRVLHEGRVRDQAGLITDLSARHTGPENRFVRVGTGSMGGKGRGVAFVSALIVRHDLLTRFPTLAIRIPKTVVLGTDVFDAFLAQVDVAELLALDSDDAVSARLAACDFPDEVRRDVRVAFDNLKGPLAVRSSSLLEDSRLQPFAGIYATYMLPNNAADRDVAYRQLLGAIKSVYASAFWREARTYLAGTPHDADDQKMAVLVQQVVGRRHGNRFYPAASGVVQSYNYYPVGGQRPEDGVAHIALGLGHTVVSGEVALRFSPGAPTVLPQFASAGAFVRGSQRSFYALDLDAGATDLAAPTASLVRLDLDAAERDGTLAIVGSVYSASDDVIRENLALPGPRLVTFNNILKWQSVPLAPALTTLLSLLRDAMGEEVEVEIALDMSPPGDTRPARLYVLQVRPMSAPFDQELRRGIDDLDPASLRCRTDVALGHGSHDIADVVWVEATELDAHSGRALAAAIGEINARLAAAGRPYLLIGPGRWGSSDPTLGVGVGWRHIHGARVIVETPIGDRRIEPSQGTHFFRNITAARIGYLTVSDTPESWLDRAWLGVLARAGGAVHHASLPSPVTVHIDGRRGHAAIVDPVRGAG
jgi:CheY-like chemotaxis protein